MTDVTGSVTTMGGSGGGSSNPNPDAKNTGQSFDVYQDARNCKEAGQYPNYWSHKTRSGHNFIMDDSEGCETVTLQHRSGTAIQMREDGGLLMTTHNGKYEVVFGENRVTISGAHDITVKGDASMRIYGNNNMTVHGDHNMTVMGDHNITAKNINYSVRGNIDTEAKNINTRVEGSGTYNYLGALSTVSKHNMTHLSTSGKMYQGAQSGHHTHVEKGDHTTKVKKGNMQKKITGKFSIEVDESVAAPGVARGKMGVGAGGSSKVTIRTQQGSLHTETSKDHNTKVGGDHNTIVTQNHNVHSTGGSITGKASGGSIQYEATQDIMHKASSAIKVLAGTTMNMQAPTGTATFAGGVTNVNALSGVLNMAAGAAGINLDALGGLLNLNGGIIGALQQALNLQLSFDFGEVLSSLDMPDIGGGQADQPEEEPDLSSEINSWL